MSFLSFNIPSILIVLFAIWVVWIFYQIQSKLRNYHHMILTLDEIVVGLVQHVTELEEQLEEHFDSET